MSNMFVRFLTREQVKKSHAQLEEAAGKPLPIDLSTNFFEIKAPDGDTVFAGIKHPSGKWMCRLHKEVFSQEVVQ